MVKAKRDLLKLFGAMSLVRKGHLEPAVQDWCLVNISKDGDSTTPLGNLCQCLVTLPVKGVWCSEGNPCVSVLWSCHCEPVRKTWLHPFCTLLQWVFKHIGNFLMQIQESQLKHTKPKTLAYLCTTLISFIKHMRKLSLFWCQDFFFWGG